jgi:N-acetylmuramoyl-L-alanine amidase
MPDYIDGLPIERIADDVFAGNTVLVSITLPEYLLDGIGRGVFEGCVNLKEVIMPDVVRFIGVRAFAGCTSLTEIKLPAALKIVGEEAFIGCIGLTELTFPYTDEIHDRAFFGCVNLAKVYMPNSVTYIGEETFEGCSPDLVITGEVGSFVHEYAAYNDTVFRDKFIGEIRNYNFAVNHPERMNSAGVRVKSGTGRKIALDVGHGMNTAGKRTPNDIREWWMGDQVARYAVSFMSDTNWNIWRVDNNNDTDTSLATRSSNLISGGDPVVAVSIHFNSLNTPWTPGLVGGVEVLHRANTTTYLAHATDLAKRMSDLIGVTNRGAKNHVVQPIFPGGGRFPYLIAEGGFMDSLSDYPTIISRTGQRAYARAINDFIRARWGNG